MTTKIKPLTKAQKKIEVDSLNELAKQYKESPPSTYTEWQRQSDHFHDLLEEIGELHDRKGRDYGTDEDQYANIRASEEFGIPAWEGSVMRANDKMARIKTFCKKGKLENEPLKDSIKDAAVYFLNAYVLLEDWENGRKK